MHEYYTKINYIGIRKFNINSENFTPKKINRGLDL
jgi:hypothetical protein